MATDNLALIHGRIATLDIYVLATVLVAAVFYVRGRALFAGIVLGVAACMKLVGLGVVPAFVLFEACSRSPGRAGVPGAVWAALRGAARRSCSCSAPPRWLLLGGLAARRAAAGAMTRAPHKTYAGSPFPHIDHMLSYAAKLKAVSHATGISSPPWEWLFDQRAINYSRIAVNSLCGGKITASRAVFDARGQINQFIIFLAIPAFLAACAAAWYERDRVAALGAAWCLGTFLPFVIQYSPVRPDLLPVLHAAGDAGRVPGDRAAVLPRPGPTGGDARMGGRARLRPLDLYPVRSLTGK